MDSKESEALKRKWSDLEDTMKAKWRDLEDSMKAKRSDLEDTMKAMKDVLVKEDADKSVKIRRLLQDNIVLEQTLLRPENPSFQGPMRPVTCTNPVVVFPAEVSCEFYI